MDNIDLTSINQTLNDRFAKPLPEYYERRIIFWNDPSGKFAEQLERLELQNATLLVLKDGNYFTVKQTIHDPANAQTNYLIYYPDCDAAKADHWLLNVELYSETFRADITAIWLNEMGIEDTPDNEQFVGNFQKFFSSKERREIFRRIAPSLRTNTQRYLTLLASICGASKPEPDAILRAVFQQGVGMETNACMNALKNYEAESLFWNMVARLCGFDPPEPKTLKALLEQILLTAASRTLPSDYLEGFELLESYQSQCCDFVTEWMHSSEPERETLYKLVRIAEGNLRIPVRISNAPVRDLLQTEVFPCVDICILTHLMTDIRDQRIHIETIQQAIEQRLSMERYSQYDHTNIYYEALAQVAQMRSFLTRHAAGFHQVAPKDIWKSYVEDYCQMDTCYRKFHVIYDKILNEGNPTLEDFCKQVADQVEGMYVHEFLDKLGACWTNACAEDFEQYGHIHGINNPQLGFYENYVKTAKSRIVVIISDALRYEAAAELAERLQQKFRCEVALSSCVGVFPTITKFGMAALLPHDHLSVAERSDGTLAVLADGQSTEANNRAAVLKAKCPKSSVTKYSEFRNMDQKERRALMSNMNVVYIYHDCIDEAGHGSGQKVFSACEKAFEEIQEIIRRISNDAGSAHVLITADHGFLYTHKPLQEYDKVAKTTQGTEELESDSRYLIARAGTTQEALLPVKFRFDDQNYVAFTPRDYIRIRKQGSTSNFVHGGISLQEMVVPVIAFHSLRQDYTDYQNHREQYDAKPVSISLLTSSRKISNMYFALSFYPEDAVGGNRTQTEYLLHFEDDAGQTVSNTVRIIANKTSTNPPERTFQHSFHLKSLKYDRRRKYQLVIVEAGNVIPPQRIEFQIDIACAFDDFNLD